MLEPADRCPFRLNTQLHLLGYTFTAQPPGVALLYLVPVIWTKELPNGCSYQGSAAIHEKLLGCRVGQHDPLVLDYKNALAGVLKQLPIVLLRAAESVFGKPTLCNVAQVGDEAWSIRRCDCHDGKLAWEFCAIAPPGLDFYAPTKYSRLARRKVAPHAVTVGLPVALGNDDLCQITADDVLPQAAEYALGGTIELNDPSAVVDNDDAVDCGARQLLQSFLAGEQFLFALLLFRNVDAQAHRSTAGNLPLHDADPAPISRSLLYRTSRIPMLPETLGEPLLFPTYCLRVLSPAHTLAQTILIGDTWDDQVRTFAVHFAIGLVEQGDPVIGIEHDEAIGQCLDRRAKLGLDTCRGRGSGAQLGGVTHNRN